MNTIGVGDPVPFGVSSYGSGDLFGSNIFGGSKTKNKTKISTKQPAFNGIKQMPLVVMSKKQNRGKIKR